MIDEDTIELVKQAELHLRNARTEINEVFFVMYRIKRVGRF